MYSLGSRSPVVDFQRCRNASEEVMGLKMVMQKIVPAGATIEELKKKAADCEPKAKQAVEPEAAKLKEEAQLYRVPGLDRIATSWQLAFVASDCEITVGIPLA